MYRDPKRWSYTFQTYTLLTMMRIHSKEQVYDFNFLFPILSSVLFKMNIAHIVRYIMNCKIRHCYFRCVVLSTGMIIHDLCVVFCPSKKSNE